MVKFKKKEISILLIDDDKHYAFLLQELLATIECPTYQIESVVNLDQANAKLDQDDYDVILLDYNLGVVNGLDMLKFFKERQIKAAIIILTGFDKPGLDQQALEYGAMDYLIKDDLNVTSFDRTLRYSVERQQWLLMAEEMSQKANQDLELAQELRDRLLSWGKDD